MPSTVRGGRGLLESASTTVVIRIKGESTELGQNFTERDAARPKKEPQWRGPHGRPDHKTEPQTGRRNLLGRASDRPSSRQPRPFSGTAQNTERMIWEGRQTVQHIQKPSYYRTSSTHRLRGRFFQRLALKPTGEADFTRRKRTGSKTTASKQSGEGHPEKTLLAVQERFR